MTRVFFSILMMMGCTASGCMPKADLSRFPVVERLENVVTSEFRSPGILDMFVGEPAKATVEVVDAGPEQRVGRAKPTVESDALKPEVAVIPAKSHIEQASAKAICTVSAHKAVVTAHRLAPLLRVEKSARPVRIRRQKESIRYSINLVNTGILDIENISLRDCLPEQVVFKSASGASAQRAENGQSSKECWKLEVPGTLRPRGVKVVTMEVEYVPTSPLVP